MTQSSLFSPQLGEQVLKTLSRYAKLPSAGVIAGQSVASAIDEILGKGKPVYNDIDIFIDSETWEKRWPEDREKYLDRMRDAEGRLTRDANHGKLADSVVYVHEAEVMADGYSRYVSVGHRNLYAITSTRTEGLLNYVQVAWQNGATWHLREKPPKERAQLEISWLTRVFDLNCTQAGVDIETGELYVTPLFEQYFKSRQLQVVTGFTPAHSLLRYLKKRAELDAFGDDDTQLSFARMMVEKSQGDPALAELRRRTFREGRVGVSGEDVVRERVRLGMDKGYEPGWQRAGSGAGSQPLSFGRKYYEMYVKHQKVLNQHFMLTRHRKQDLWLLTSKTAVQPDPNDRIYVSPALVALRFADSRRTPSKLDTAREAGLAELIVAVADNEDAGLGLTKAFRNLGHDYLDGLEDANLRKRWLDVVPKHPEFFWTIVSLRFRDQVTVLRRLRTEFKKIGIREPWGALAGYPSSWIKGLLTNEEQWAELLESHKGSLEPLCTPLPLPKVVGNVAVAELNSSLALKAEGVRQHHCVASYSQSVRDNRSRIVSLSKGVSAAERSTVEWGVRVQYSDPDENGRQVPTSVHFDKVQHQGFGNSRPAEDLVDAEEQIRDQLNEWAESRPADAFAVLALSERLARQLSSPFADDDDVPF